MIFNRVLATRVLLGMVAGLAVGALISEVTYVFLRRGEDRAPQVVELNIPSGTARLVELGQSEPSLPASMAFVVGDVLVVHNLDEVNHQLGPLLIPAGSTARLRLDSEQTYTAECSFQPSRSFGIEVQPVLTAQTRLIGILEAGIPLGFLFILYGVFAIPRARPRND